MAGSAPSREQRQLAAVLDAGADAALSHATAAYHGKMWRRSPSLEVVRTRAHPIRRPTLARVHRVRDLRAGHVIAVDGLRVTTPARTVMDLAATMPLEERIGQTPAESGLEYRMADIARRFGLGPMRRQIDIYGDDGWIARVDFLHEHQPVAVLIDGDAWHRAITQVAADDLESRRLRAAGLDVVRVSELEVLYDERTVVRRMRAALEPTAVAA